MRRSGRVVGVALALGVVAAGTPARAALGEQDTSVERDRAAHAMRREAARPQAGATVHELLGPVLAVREYADASGKIFAVAWNGIARPDLPALLGAYHGEYRAAAARPTGGRGPRRVEAPNVVVETWGQGRGVHGRAWVPALVPPGVSLDDVR